MSKKIHLGASFIMVGGFLSTSSLHSWGLGWDWSLILGFGFIIIIWLSLVWIIRKVFEKW